MIRIVIGALLALVGMAGAGHAQSWPTKPVKVVVPITAGSAIDIVARTRPDRKLPGVHLQKMRKSRRMRL